VKKDIWKKERRWPKYVGYALILIVLVYAGYSTYRYYNPAEEIEEYDVCSDGKCVKTFRVHAKIEFELCGEPLHLPQDKGPLDGAHTHKRRNDVHFHDRLSYDQETGRLLETTPLRLDTVMNEFDIKFNDKCIAEYCNGQQCDDGPGTVRMFVNGEPNTEVDKYVWQDDDEILITFN